MRRLIVLTLTLALIPSVAQAGLTKGEARRQAVHFAKGQAREWGWVSWWNVQRARNCDRRSRLVVICRADFVDETDLSPDGYFYGCQDTIRVRETSKRYVGRFSRSPDCGYYWD